MRSLSRIVRLSLHLSTVVAAVAVPQATFIQEARAASSTKKNVAVGAFEGAKSDDVRSAFIEALKKDGGYEVTDAEDVKHTAKDKQIAEAAKGLAVNVVITGKVTKFNLKLKVRDGSNGKVLEQVDIKGGTLPKLKTNIGKTAASSVEGPVGKAKGEKKKAEEEKPKEEEKPAEDAAKEGEDKPAEEEEKPDEPSTPGEAGELSPLDITAGLRPYHRSFDFHQTIAQVRPMGGFTPMLRYELPLGPALFIDLNFYPLSFIMKGPAEWIGITGGFEKGFATSSVFLEGQKNAAGMSLERTLKTDLQQFHVGARFRVPIGEQQLSLAGEYGQHKFTLAGDEAFALVPDIKYSFARAELRGLFRIGDFLAGFNVGKRFVLGVGPIGEFSLKNPWFPEAKASSLEAGVLAGYRLVSMLDLVVGFDWLRYAFDFNPVPARPAGYESYVAGGAVDQYYAGYIGFRFHLPASDGAPPGGAAVSASTE